MQSSLPTGEDWTSLAIFEATELIGIFPHMSNVVRGTIILSLASYTLFMLPLIMPLVASSEHNNYPLFLFCEMLTLSLCFRY